MKAASPGHASGNIELIFPGHPFESLGRALDPVLAVIAIGRKQPDHIISAAGGRTRDIAGSKMTVSPTVYLCFNAHSITQQSRPCHGPACNGRIENPVTT
jgi:hypothetical protein